MNDLTKFTAAVLAALTLSACTTDESLSRSESATSRQASSNAETACMAAVNSNYGGKVRNIRVISSEFSEANSTVMMEAKGERWRCLASNDGNVEDLAVVQ